MGKRRCIKRLASNSRQGEHEFVTEIETLSKLQHVKPVSLVGYCNEHTEMILVYEYIPCGTLADYLYKLSGTSDDCSSSLTWNQRLNICIGSGRVGSRASGSLQKDHNQVDINTLPTAVPVIQEDASKDEQTVIMLPSVESEDKLTVNLLPIAVVPAIPILESIGITNNFSAECLIGEGSNGSVYRGFKNGQAAAIKILSRSSLLEQDVLAQVSIASSLKHENVVQLLGYCVDGGRQFLSYAFAQGSLHDFLHNSGVLRKGVKGSHSWSQRVKVAVGAAKGLEYIHEKGHIHCNIKSSNVLLFDNGEVAKIADINLAYRRGQSSRSDVYCFGVVLLELLTGHEPVDYPWLDMDLATWHQARPKLHKNKVKEIVDARLKGDYPQSAVATMAEVASRCVQYEPSSRPDMCNVVKDLQPLLNS
ncbi:hypothetical protein ACS0TY_028946 [Phlomoides rotata]